MWWQSLEIGDLVCDCDYQHQRIVYAEKDYITRQYCFWYLYVPNWIPDWLDERLYRLQKRFPSYEEWVDTSLILEDGRHCSAKHCCDSVDHTWEHSESANGAHRSRSNKSI